MKEMNMKHQRERCLRSVRNAAIAGVLSALLAGCGGGGGGGGTPGGGTTLTGDNLQFASVVSDLKATAAGSAGPFQVLQTIQAAAAPGPKRVHPFTPQFVDFLQLYVDTVVSTNKITMNYSTAADGKSTSGQTVISTTDNKTFHATGHITGSLAMTLDVTVVLTDTAGANTMSGTVSLDTQGITCTLKNLSADDSGNVGSSGEMDVDYQGFSQTKFTSLTGKASGDIKGNVTVQAAGQTFTGTGTINLLNGTIQLNVTAPGASNPLTAFLIAKLNSSISFTDGKTINVNDILNFDLSKLTGSSGGLPTGGGGTGYNAPVALNLPAGASNGDVWQALSNGQMVGQATMSGSTAPEAVYWDSPAATATALPVPVGVTQSVAYAIANTGSKRMIVGSYVFSDGYVHACMWTSSSTSGSTNFNAPTTFPIDSSLYPTGGTARAISPNGAHIVGSVTKGGIDVPVVFTSGRVFELPMGSIAGMSYDATGVSNSGNVLGLQNLRSNPEVWLNVTISGSTISASRQDLLNTNSSNIPATEAFHMGADGTVAGGQGDGKALFWDSGAYVAHVLTTSAGNPAVAYAVSDDGSKFAGLLNPSNNSIDLAYWSSKTSAATDVSATLPSNDFTQLGADFILSDGSFIAFGQKSGTQGVVFVYVKKK